MEYMILKKKVSEEINNVHVYAETDYGCPNQPTNAGCTNQGCINRQDCTSDKIPYRK